MSGKSKNVEAASRVYFPLPDLSRKIERDSARRVEVRTYESQREESQSLCQNFTPADSGMNETQHFVSLLQLDVELITEASCI